MVVHPDLVFSVTGTLCCLCSHKIDVDGGSVRNKRMIEKRLQELSAQECPHSPCSAASRAVIAADQVKQAGWQMKERFQRREKERGGLDPCGGNCGQKSGEEKVIFDGAVWFARMSFQWFLF